MGELGWNVIFINNLKLLGADLDYFKLPDNPSKLNNAFISYPRPLLIKLFGFLVKNYDPQKYKESVEPYLTHYSRAIDITLKSTFHQWIRSLNTDYKIYLSFPKVWNLHNPDVVVTFFAVVSSIVLEKTVKEADESLSGVKDYVGKFLTNVSLLPPGTPCKDTTFNETPSVLIECLNYANVSDSSSVFDALEKLSSFQKERWMKLQILKRGFSALHSKWLSMKQLYSDMSTLASAPQCISSSDFIQAAPQAEPPSSLSRLIEKSTEIFAAARKALFRPIDQEPHSELSWCCNSLKRIIESQEFQSQKIIDGNVEIMSDLLDSLIASFRTLIDQESDELSVLFNRSSGRPSGLFTDRSINSSKSRISTQGPVSNAASPVLQDSRSSLKSHFLPDLVELKQDFGSDEEWVPSKSLLKNSTLDLSVGSVDSSRGEALVKSFDLSDSSGGPEKNDELIDNINQSLIPLLEVTNLNADPDEDEVEEEEMQKRFASPDIMTPLMPLKRPSLKSLRFETPARLFKAEADENTEGLLKSFSDFTPSLAAFANGSARDSRAPFASIDTNTETEKKSSLSSSFGKVKRRKSSSSNANGQGDNNGGPNDGDSDGSLGLLSLDDMDDSPSKLLFSP